MPIYSDDIIEEVRARNDIVDVISQYVKLQKKGNSYFGLCPFHNEKTPSFSVSRDKQMYYCFGCGAGGNVYNFEMQYNSLSFPEAVEVLADRAGITLPKREMTEEQKRQYSRKEKLREINKEAARYFFASLYSEKGHRALEYFHNRGLTDETIRHFGLGYAGIYRNELYKYMKSRKWPDELLRDSGLFTWSEKYGFSDKFWNRAMFPIMDVNSHVIGFGGRVMGEGEPKYLNSPETPIFDKSRNLYALNFARTSRKDHLLLCEGYMDAIALHQAGFTQAVASLGTSLTSGHANLLSRYANTALLCYDSDGAGIKAALRAIPILNQAGFTVRVIQMTPHKDPDEFIGALGADAFQERIDCAENSFMFEIRMMERKYNLDDPGEKTEFHRAVARRLLQFSQEQERENYLEAVAEKYHIGFDNLRSLMRSEGTRGGITAQKPRPKPKSGIHSKEKEDGNRVAQKLLLTWLTDHEELFDEIEPFIGPDDFVDPMLHEIAVLVFTGHRDGAINPAAILDRFTDEEQHREAASIFYARIQAIETEREWNKAVQDTVYRVKKNSIDTRLRKTHDLEQTQNIMKERDILGKIKEKTIWQKSM